MIKKVIFTCLIFLFLLNSVSFALSVPDEDSWLGAYFFKENLNKKERLIPYIDIRENNYEKEKDESYFKTILADFIIAQNLKLFEDINIYTISEDNINTVLNELNFEDKERAKTELDLLYSLKEEVNNKYEKLEENLPTGVFYRFYHIKGERFHETVISDNEKIEDLGTYKDSFSVKEDEFKDSKENTQYINSLIPLSYEDIRSYEDSPLVSVEDNRYDEETKEKIKNESEDINFIEYTHIDIKENEVKISDLEDIKNFFGLLELDSVKLALEEVNYEPEIKEIDKLLEIIKGEL